MLFQRGWGGQTGRAIASAAPILHGQIKGIWEECMTKTARLGRCGVLVLAGLIGTWLGSAAAQAEDANKADIEALKKSLAKYEDYTAAIR
ncbi:hypothetical protein EN792_049355, partial [Mesorhizobium sp. M00.F.Ca.ET.149.01.1.1]